MSDLQALYLFLRKPVSSEMIHFLVATTNSVINVKQPSVSTSQYPSPPSSPLDEAPKVVSLYNFIEALVRYSHVQTPTLMSALVYLTRLREILPPNSTGMETTRHRIFLGCLILAAKNLNDSSPMNKHWCKYTDGLLSLKDVNALEIELIGYLGWSNIRIHQDDLIKAFSPYLDPIKRKLIRQTENKIAKQRDVTASIMTPPISSSLSQQPTEPLFASKAAQIPRYLPSPTLSDQTYRPTLKRTLGSGNLAQPTQTTSTSSIPSLMTSSSSIPSLLSTSSTVTSSGSQFSLNSYAETRKLQGIVEAPEFHLKPLRLSKFTEVIADKENLYNGPSQSYPHQLRVVNGDFDMANRPRFAAV